MRYGAEGVHSTVWNLWDVFASEFFGTTMLLLLGAGVVATNLLPKSKGRGGGWLMINWGWGLAVLVGVYAAWKTGGHLNPAVTVAKVVAYWFDPEVTLNGAAVGSATAVDVTFGNVLVYFAAQFLGAFVGAVLAYLAFKKQFDQDCDPALKLGVFSTGPEVRSYGWNLVTEAIWNCSSDRLRHGCRRHTERGWSSGRRPRHCRYRRLPWWPDRLRYQPSP